MPLLSPSQIHEVLKKESSAIERKGLAKVLDDHNLSPEDLLMNLSSMTRGADTDGVRLRAIETGLKLNNLLNGEDAKENFVVNITISDSQYSVNPILIPR